MRTASKPRTMTVGQIRKGLDGLSDDTPVVLTGGPDHSYQNLRLLHVLDVEPGPDAYYEWDPKEDGKEHVEAVVIEVAWRRP